MNRTRGFLVLMAMTTALCADQMAVAAPTSGPRAIEIGQIAQRVVSRLSESFRETVPTALHEPRQPAAPQTPAAIKRATAPIAVVAHQPSSPFQFRLPPPIA
jgi:hypothetical protein